MKDDIVFLHHILESAELIEDYISDTTKDNFLTSYKTQDAIIRRLEIIGEATKNISLNFKKKHPQLPWKAMAGMRDVVIHDYFGIDFHEIWDTAFYDIPELKQQIIDILKTISPQP